MKSRSITDILTKTHALSVVNNKPRSAYDAVSYLNPSSIAAGLIDHVDIDPMAVKYAFENPNQKRVPPSQQDTLDRGTLGHMMLLQPERVPDEVRVWDGKVRNGGEWEAFEADNIGKLIVRRVDYESVNAAVKAFRFNKRINELITECDVEVAVFSEEDCIFTKGLMDAVTKGKQCNILDPKFTMTGMGYRPTNNTIRDLNYREKMAAYKRWLERESGREVLGCYNIFLSLIPPYAVRIKKMSTMALEWGEQRILSAIGEVRKCLDADKWPMFVTEDIVIVDEWEKLDDSDQITFGGEAL